jgi:hypothetical protein
MEVDVSRLILQLQIKFYFRRLSFISVICIVYVYLCNGVCLFIGVCFLFVWWRATLLEADCVVEDSNLFEDDPQDTFG